MRRCDDKVMRGHCDAITRGCEKGQTDERTR